MHVGTVEPRSIMGGRLALAIGLVACLLAALVPAAANAAAGVTVAPAFPSNVTIGQTGVSGEVVITNSNTSPEVSSTICNAGDPGLCAGSPGITLIPSCSATDFEGNCSPAGADPNVFALSPTAIGTSGSACDGRTFTVTVIDAIYGKVRFTPTTGNVVLSGPTSACRIQFSFSVLKSPVDARPLVAGRQTLQVVEALVRTDQETFDFDRAVGAATTVKLAAPVVTASDPGSPANANSPQLTGTAPAGTTIVSIYTNASCTGSPVVQGAPVTFASPGLSVSVGDDSSTTFYAQGTDGDGGLSNCSATGFTYVEDSTPPSAPTLEDTDPDSPANDNSPEIKGSAPAGSTVRLYKTNDCTGAIAAQGSAASFASPGLTASVTNDSTTTFHATATDAAGNLSGCSTSFAVYVEDSTPPTSPTTASSDPVSPSNVDTPRIVGTAPPGTTVTLYTTANCTGTPAGSGSAAAYASPGIQVVVAPNSTTTFYSTATDAAGNASPCSATGTVYVEDSIPPPGAALSGASPASPANDNSPRLKGSAQAGSTVRLYTDAACTSAVAGEGSAATFASPGIAVSVADDSTTTFYAQATDAAGNSSACSAPASYTEDSTAPDTTVDVVPSGTGATTFTFASTEAGVRFECRIDLGAFAPCSSPYTTGALAAGAHTFEVRAIDSAGNADSSSAGRTFMVATAATPPPPPAATPPTRAQPGCIGVKGTLWVGTNNRNVRLGGRGTDIMFGLGGHDTLRGQAGLDCLYGGNGNDRLYGVAGNDRLYGGTGNDLLDGGTGNDRLSDRRGRDRFSGGAGNDRIDARDATLAGRRGVDVITCGKGIDTVLADPRDRVAKDCEKSKLIRRSLPTVAAR
jgi:Ca2+-binding RTX toxin-like protein